MSHGEVPAVIHMLLPGWHLFCGLRVFKLVVQQRFIANAVE